MCEIDTRQMYLSFKAGRNEKQRACPAKGGGSHDVTDDQCDKNTDPSNSKCQNQRLGSLVGFRWQYVL